MVFLKGIGLLLIFVSASLLGFFYAFRVKKRVKKIEGICTSVKLLANDIKIGSGSKEELILKRFSKESAYFSAGKPIVNRSFLKTEEADVLEEFLIELGCRDRTFEYKRATSYLNQLEEILKKAAAESDKICKLYCSMGMLVGVMLCILLI